MVKADFSDGVGVGDSRARRPHGSFRSACSHDRTLPIRSNFDRFDGPVPPEVKRMFKLVAHEGIVVGPSSHRYRAAVLMRFHFEVWCE